MGQEGMGAGARGVWSCCSCGQQTGKECSAGFLLSAFYSAWDPTHEWSCLHIQVGFPSLNVRETP